MPPLTREERADRARVAMDGRFSDKQRGFLDFVLGHYISEGVDELARDKLKPLLLLKYHDSFADALADLGRPEEIGAVFGGFQKHLYEERGKHPS
jgi:type I restriction enzyme R subunit